MKYTYMPMRGSMGDVHPTKRREALVAAHDATPNAERERIDGMTKELGNKYDNVGQGIALEILSAIGIGLGKEGWEPLTMP